VTAGVSMHHVTPGGLWGFSRAHRRKTLHHSACLHACLSYYARLCLVSWTCVMLQSMCEIQLWTSNVLLLISSLGPFYEAIAVPSVTRCRCCRWRCRCRRGQRCAGGVRQRHLVNGRAAARSGEWAQHFSYASCLESRVRITAERRVIRGGTLASFSSCHRELNRVEARERRTCRAVSASAELLGHMLFYMCGAGWSFAVECRHSFADEWSLFDCLSIQFHASSP